MNVRSFRVFCVSAALLAASVALPQVAPPPAVAQEAEAPLAPAPLDKQMDFEARSTRRAALIRLFTKARVRYQIDPPLQDELNMVARGPIRNGVLACLHSDHFFENDAAGKPHPVEQEYGCRIEPDGTYHVYAKPRWTGAPGRPDLKYATLTMQYPGGTRFTDVLNTLSGQLNMPCKIDPAYNNVTTGSVDYRGASVPDTLRAM